MIMWGYWLTQQEGRKEFRGFPDTEESLVRAFARDQTVCTNKKAEVIRAEVREASDPARKRASHFGQIFSMLATDPTSERKKIAQQIWTLRSDYDFSESEMECDWALIDLGLAVKENDQVVYAEE